MSSTLCLYFYHDQSKVFGLLNLVYMRNKTDFHCCLLGNLPPRICLSSFWFCILDPHRHNRNLVHWWQETLECIHSTRTRCSSCHQMLKCKVRNILREAFSGLLKIQAIDFTRALVVAAGLSFSASLAPCSSAGRWRTWASSDNLRCLWEKNTVSTWFGFEFLLHKFCCSFHD